MPKRRYIQGFSKKYLESGDYSAAMLRISADLESFLKNKLFFEKKIPIDLMDNWTLGRCLKKISKLGMITNNHMKVLEEFKELRNDIVHQRVIFERIKKDEKKLDTFVKLLSGVMKFMETTWIEYESNKELEVKYSRYITRSKDKWWWDD